MNRSPFMFSWSGQLNTSDFIWSILRIALVGVILISLALLYAKHMAEKIKVAEQRAMLYAVDYD